MAGETGIWWLNPSSRILQFQPTKIQTVQGFLYPEVYYLSVLFNNGVLIDNIQQTFGQYNCWDFTERKENLENAEHNIFMKFIMMTYHIFQWIWIFFHSSQFIVLLHINLFSFYSYKFVVISSIYIIIKYYIFSLFMLFAFFSKWLLHFSFLCYS